MSKSPPSPSVPATPFTKNVPPSISPFPASSAPVVSVLGFSLRLGVSAVQSAVKNTLPPRATMAGAEETL